MPLYFVTGISGAGKSTVRKHLQLQGYEAYEIDESGLSAWYDDGTGEQHALSATSEDRTPEFGQRYSWRASREKVAQLAASAAGRPVFLCGAVANEVEILDLFTAAITLDVDIETLQERLAARTNNDFGKSAHERAQILSWHADDYAAFRRPGHVIVDAARPIDDVVGEVLRLTIGGEGD